MKKSKSSNMIFFSYFLRFGVIIRDSRQTKYENKLNAKADNGNEETFGLVPEFT